MNRIQPSVCPKCGQPTLFRKCPDCILIDYCGERSTIAARAWRNLGRSLRFDGRTATAKT